MDDNIRVRIDDDDAPAASVPERKASEDTAGRQAAEEIARSRAEVRKAHGEILESQRQTVANGIAQAETLADVKRRELVQAKEQGNFEDEVRLQSELNDLAVRKAQMQEAASHLDAAVSQHQRQPADPVEAYVANRTEPTAKWLRAHRDWVEDPKKNAKLTSAHWSAVAEGLKPDSDQYFEHVERTIGLHQGHDSDETSQHRNPDGVTVTKMNPGDPIPKGAVRMSRGEYEAATETITWNYTDPQGRFKKGEPIGVREYLRRKQAMRAEGRFNQLDGY